MCGHFALNHIKLVELIERYSILDVTQGNSEFLQENVKNNYYPSRQDKDSDIYVILNDPQGRRSIILQRWDLVPRWWKKPLKEKKFSSFNARKDSLIDKPTFKHSWNHRQRCIIPATCFFERPDKNSRSTGETRKEYRIEIKEERIFSMAGIWEECALPEREKSLQSCTIITIEANESISRIPHERMPVIIKKEEENAWLDSSVSDKEAYELLKQLPSETCLVNLA